ncbi:MAG: hypothetical protein TR69_WS6001001111 [candidate division WS6 bacterium OLB20]|uniref:Glycosyltransferase RgtA/B/C/D-like domain-containing protein n=1 Tax=candidate division WS6 bacterium OLB20 TaxID=1617426 RepID=A0A136LZL1_9BACT|nr:MAG: hypothetical protein TR69_WS6001001111 [candidate division WS6 bacterium OLB20]
MIDWLRSSLKLVRRYRAVFTGVLVCVLPAAYLMLTTMSYSDNHIILSQTIWSDFTGHYPLIRSFSEGYNWSLESPTFTGELIRYHFGFYFLAALLEMTGIRIDIAINLLSIIGFAGMLLLAYFAALRLGRRIAAGVTAVLLILFNPSWSWYYYLHPDHLGLKTVQDIVTNQNFGSFGPYDNHVISAFWSLNVFLHQRHLAFSFLLLGLVFLFMNLKHSRTNKAVAIVLTLMLSWINQAVLMVLFVLLGINIIEHILHKKNWAQLTFFVCTAVAVSLTAITFISSSAISGGSAFKLQPGFIYYGTEWVEFPFVQGDFARWLVYWILNIGILPLLAFAGFILIRRFHRPAGKTMRARLIDLLRQILVLERVPFVSAVIMFIIANLFIFARDPSTNHKFINYVIVVWSVYAAVFLVRLLTLKRAPAFIVLLVCVTLGGFFDLWPVVNANRHMLADIEASDTAVWIKDNTPRDARFMNVTADFNPVMSTGRKLFFGPQYINWSLGYDTLGRLELMRQITRGTQPKEFVCQIAQHYSLSYIIVTKFPDTYLETPVDLRYFEDNFVKLFSDSSDYYRIYDINASCSTSDPP